MRRKSGFGGEKVEPKRRAAARHSSCGCAARAANQRQVFRRLKNRRQIEGESSSSMQTPEAKILLKSMKKEDPSIFNIQYSQLKDVVSLASGNFGDVYCGFYKKRKVAVKHLLDVDDEKMHKYLRREISTLKSLQHSNIVEFIGRSHFFL